MKITKTLTSVLLFGSLLLSGCNSSLTSSDNKNESSSSMSSGVDNSMNSFKETSSSTTGRIAVTGVALDKSSLTLFVGETVELHATVLPSNAYYQGVTWRSSDSKIVSVGWISGYFTAVSAGSATITATTNDGGFTASCIVTVKNVSVTSISLNKDTITLEEDETYRLYETIEPSNASDKTTTWSSSDDNVVTVDDRGRVTAINRGEAVITVTTKDGGFTASCKVIVAEKARYEYSLDETTVEIYTYKPTYGDAIDYIRLVTPIKNTGNRNIYCGSCTYDIEDSSGNVLQSIDSVSCEPNIIKPGETTYYYEEIKYTGSVKEGIKAIPHPTVKKARNQNCVRYDVSNVSFKNDDSYGLEAVGKITNNTSASSSWAIVAIHVFDKNDNFVVTLHTNITKEISSDETISFNVSSLDMYRHKDFTADDVGRYEAIAYEWTLMI